MDVAALRVCAVGGVAGRGGGGKVAMKEEEGGEGGGVMSSSPSVSPSNMYGSRRS